MAGRRLGQGLRLRPQRLLAALIYTYVCIYIYYIYIYVYMCVYVYIYIYIHRLLQLAMGSLQKASNCLTRNSSSNYSSDSSSNSLTSDYSSKSTKCRAMLVNDFGWCLTAFRLSWITFDDSSWHQMSSMQCWASLRSERCAVDCGVWE